MIERRWHPWRELRQRAHVTLVFDRLADRFGGAFYGVAGDHAAVVISPELDQVERRCALAHELVHDERRVTRPHATDATMELEEERVRRETARRLVPLEDLAELVATRIDVDPITVELVANEYDVTSAVAAEALRQLQARLLDAELRRASGG